MRTLTDDLLDILRDDGDYDVGDATGEGLAPPFRVLYPLPQQRDGTWGNAFGDVVKHFQVTCEATSRQQAEWLADLTDTQLFAADLVIVPSERPEVTRDDTTGDPSRFKAWVRFRVRTYDPHPQEDED